MNDVITKNRFGRYIFMSGANSSGALYARLQYNAVALTLNYTGSNETYTIVEAKKQLF